MESGKSGDSWEYIKENLKIGSHVFGHVLCHEPYGFFVSISGNNFQGLVQITDIKDDERVFPADYPAIGTYIEAVVLGFRDVNQQIWLGIKPSQVRRDAP